MLWGNSTLPCERWLQGGSLRHQTKVTCFAEAAVWVRVSVSERGDQGSHTVSKKAERVIQPLGMELQTPSAPTNASQTKLPPRW